MLSSVMAAGIAGEGRLVTVQAALVSVQAALVSVQAAQAAGKSVPDGPSRTNAVLVTVSGARVTAIGAIAANLAIGAMAANLAIGAMAANVAIGHGAPAAGPGTSVAAAGPGTSVAARTVTSGSVVAGRAPSDRDATLGQIRPRPRGPVTTGPGDRGTAATVPRVVTATSDGLPVLRAAADRDPIQQRLATVRSAWTSQKASRPTS